MKDYLSIVLHISCMVLQGGGHYTQCQWMKKNVMVNEIAWFGSLHFPPFVISSEWIIKCVVGFAWFARILEDQHKW